MTTLEIKSRIEAAFGDRTEVAMNTAGEIGQGNFYGDETDPIFNRDEVLDLINCALENWTVPEDADKAEWTEEIVEKILGDIK